MREGTGREFTRFLHSLFDLVQVGRWEGISSPDSSSDHSLSSGRTRDSQRRGRSRISTRTALNIVALAIAR